MQEALDKYCVVLSLDKNHPERFRAMNDFVRADSHSRIHIFSCRLQLLAEIDLIEGIQSLPELINRIKSLAQQHGVQPLNLVSRSPSVCETPGSGSLSYEASSRLLSLDAVKPPWGTRWQYPAYPTDPEQSMVTGTLEATLQRRTRVVVGTRSVLSAATVQGMIPAPEERVPGRSWKLPQAVIAQLVAEFRPPTWYTETTPATIERLDYTAQVRRVDPAGLEIALQGYVDAPDPWFPTGPTPPAPSPPVIHHAKARFAGYYQIRLPEGRIERLALATQGAILVGPDGTFLPFASVVQGGSQPATGSVSSSISTY